MYKINDNGVPSICVEAWGERYIYPEEARTHAIEIFLNNIIIAMKYSNGVGNTVHNRMDPQTASDVIAKCFENISNQIMRG
jgi:hypothetical protein